MNTTTLRQLYVAPVTEVISLAIEKNLLAGGSVTEETGQFTNEGIDYEEI